MVRSYSTRRSKIEDIWTMSEFKTDSPSNLDTLGPQTEIIGTVQNSSRVNELSSRIFSSNPKERHKVDWVRSALVLSGKTNLTLGQVNSEGVNVDNLEKLNGDVSVNQDFKSMIFQTTRRSSVENDSAANRSHVLKGTNITGITIRNNTSTVEKDRQKLDLIGSDSLYNKHIVRNNILISKQQQQQNSSVLPLQLTDMTIHHNHHKNIMNTPLYDNQHSIDKITGRNVSSYENLKEVIAVSSPRPDSIQRDIVNNLEKPAGKIETRLIQNSKAKIISRNPSSFHRNFVRLSNSPTVSNHPNEIKYALNVSYRDTPEDTSNGVTLKTHAEVKEDNDLRSIVIPITESNKSQAAVKEELDSNDDASFKSTENRHSLHTQKLPSHSERIKNSSKTRDEYKNVPVHKMHLKNWPNEWLENIEDLYNYEKYVSPVEQTDQNSMFQDQDSTDQIHTPILPLNGDFINHPDPVLESSMQKIIHWLKIPILNPNKTHVDTNKLYKPVESVLESFYENLEPNHTLNVDSQEPYPDIVLQAPYQDESFDQIDYQQHYPNRWPSPNLIIRPQYIPSSTIAPSLVSKISPTKNSSIINPTTHVTQDMTIHILNNDIKKANVTQLKVPQSSIKPTMIDQSTSDSSTVQNPNVNVMFTSQEDKNNSTEELNTDCPTILINSYTRVNNTIQSKDGCTDLNIIINSHILSSNVFQPSNGPIDDQQTSLGTQSYDYANESDKHGEDVNDLAHQDSLESYVTPSTNGSAPLETPQSIYNDYYNSQKDPNGISESGESVISPGSSIEIYHGTQISLPGSNVPLKDAEATADPHLTGADGPAGLSADGSPAGNDAASGTTADVSPGFTPGTVMGQANNALMPGTLQLPALPSRPSLPARPSLSGVSNALASSSPSSPSPVSQNDDDDDDFDLSPGGILQSVTSVFTYLAFLDPLSYSVFSLAAAPFAAMAAGVLGIAAFMFPSAFSGVLDFGRASNQPTIVLRPHIDEFARQIIPYNRVNEWKRRRRKHRK